MSENYARSALRVSAAQICQALGWDAVQLSACDLLSDVLDRYIQQLARSCHRYAELYGRTDPILSDIGQAFGLLGVSLSELEDYVNHLEPASFPQSTHLFPVAKSSTLQFPSPREERRDYIPDYLPPLVSLQEDEEEEQVPVAMGTSAEAMQVSVEEDEDGGLEEDYDDENENAENRPTAKRDRGEADLDAFPLGVMPTAKRPRLGIGINPDSSPEWTSEPREPLSSLNAQMMPPSPSTSSPPMSPAHVSIMPMPLVRPPATPGRKPPRPAASPGRKAKSPRRGGGANVSPARTPKAAAKDKKKKNNNSPRSPRGGGAHGAHATQLHSPPLGMGPKGGMGGRGGVGGGGGGLMGHSDLHRGGAVPVTDEGDIDDSISAVIARACGSNRPHDPYDLPSDSDSDSDPGLSLSHTLLGRHGAGAGAKGLAAPLTPAHPKHAPTGGRAALTSTPLMLGPGSHLHPHHHQHHSSASSSAYSLDRSIDEVVRQAGKRGGGGVHGLGSSSHLHGSSSEDPDDELSSPPLSPPTPQPMLPKLSLEDFSILAASAAPAATDGKKKKPKKEAKLKTKKQGKGKEKKEKEKGHDKGSKAKEKKKDKKSKEKDGGKLSWRNTLGDTVDDLAASFGLSSSAAAMLSPAMALTLAEERAAVAKDNKDKHRGDKKNKDKDGKSKKEKGKKEKGGGGGGGKEKVGKKDKKKKMSAEEREREASLALFGPSACLFLPSATPIMAAAAATTPIMADKKGKEKDKKKDKKEKKKKKEKEKEREKERVAKEKEAEKEEKKKGKEKEKGGKAKEKAKDIGKAEKAKAVVEPPPVLSSPVIPRLTLRVGAGQDKIVISKVVPDSDPTAPAAAPPPAPVTPLPPTGKTPTARSGPGSRGGRGAAAAASHHPALVIPTPPPPLPPAPAPSSAPLLPPLGKHTPGAPLASGGPAASAGLASGKGGGCSVVTETVSAYVIRDEWGNKIWICPGCNKPDDGSPMIGCDQCDDWYHWPCVGILTPPPEDQEWFCVKCAGKKTDKKQKKRRRKN
ncbi:transcription initiation factor TFIID subunit 3 [Engraulis encrasicolus]|uniref:transcription initiation factor TFIID subunit 3 n=1 Tax=Engraulis encrasicolus TaxID=184585 RepID=UPI002FD5613F